MKRAPWIFFLLVSLMSAAASQAATLVVNDHTFEVSNTLADPTDLWVSPEDFTRINGFVVKPEGACLDEICVPLPQDEDSDLFVMRQGKRWINVTRFADKIQQAYAVDHDKGVWSFGQVPAKRTPFLKSAIAPDFSLTDRNGEVVRLADFRGKKVMIITWASW